MTEKPASGAHSGPDKASEAWPRKVRTTMQPWREIEVGPEEYHDLSARGVIETKGSK